MKASASLNFVLWIPQLLTLVLPLRLIIFTFIKDFLGEILKIFLSFLTANVWSWRIYYLAWGHCFDLCRSYSRFFLFTLLLLHYQCKCQHNEKDKECFSLTTNIILKSQTPGFPNHLWELRYILLCFIVVFWPILLIDLSVLVHGTVKNDCYLTCD